MERKTKKIKPEKPRQGPNIVDLLQQTRETARPKMAAYPETYSELSDNFSSGDEEADLTPMQRPTPAAQKADASPVTTAVLKTLLADLQKNIQTDVASLRNDIHGLRGRMGALETASNVCSDQITSLQQVVQGLQKQNEEHERRFTALEDARRANNIKVRGIPEDTPQAEMPHLLVALLSPRQAKAITMDSFFRAPKSASAPAAAPQDLIVRFQQYPAKTTVLAATRNCYPYKFKTMALSFYTDLTGGTLAQTTHNASAETWTKI
ncbi:Hypothetical predicted protein [Pelobates cultripes]|uniref:Uncharacterized protein n=1 Tax=Pelobates cultripes TaxID=61616 RepID=A0AAD1S680_PELCU|nr:Hypothetical predicted protein [Pelobates cultripes]